MAKKSVTVNVTSQPLSREENGVVFVISDGKLKFGELVVSQGGVRWKQKGKQSHHFMNWSQLDKAMQAFPKK